MVDSICENSLRDFIFQDKLKENHQTNKKLHENIEFFSEKKEFIILLPKLCQYNRRSS